MGILDDIGKSLNKVGKKTSDMANVAKLKLDITKLNADLDKKYEDLGSRVYFLKKENVPLDESVDAMIEFIDKIFVNIKELEKEISNLSDESKETRCIHCNENLPEHAQFCGSCGARVKGEEKISKECPNCGAVVEDNNFCQKCGTGLE